MKTKKAIIAVLTVALLISAALIVGCTNPMDGVSVQRGGGGGDSVKAPAGKGIIKLSIADSDARTILPDLPDVEDMFYQVQFFTDSGDSTFSVAGPTVPANLATDNKVAFSAITGSNVIALTAAPTTGTRYKVVITAFDSAAFATAVPIAGWTSASPHILVMEDSVTPVAANLIGFANGDDDGLFAYSITYNALVTSSFTITPAPNWGARTLDVKKYASGLAGASVKIADGASVNFPIDINNIATANTSGTDITLPSGYYYVIVTLKASANCQDRVYESVMHIYPTLKSTLTLTSTDLPSPNQNTFSVQFDLNGQPNNNGGAYGGTNPKTISSISNASSCDPGAPLNLSYTFDGWYTNNNGTGTEFVPTVTKVFKDMFIYGKWTTGTGIEFGSGSSITFTVTDATIGNVLSGTGAGASYDDFKTGGSIRTFTLGGGTFSGITWRLNGVDLGINTNTFIINAAYIDTLAPLLNTGVHYLFVGGTKDGQSYSQAVIFNISNG
jgi:hypothetical protein